MPTRRGHGEGAIFRRHDKHCPPVVDGERPDHKCYGLWVAEVNLGTINGKRKRKTIYGRTRKEAAMKLAQANAQKADNSLVIGSVSMETWLKHWLEVVCPERGIKPNTVKTYRSKINQYLIPNLGAIRVDRLTADHIRAMYSEMRARGLSETTLTQTHAILRRALVVAVRERKASHNAADLLDRPKALDNAREALTLAEAKRVLRVAGSDPRFYLSLYMGMRQGECLALRWSDIDFAAETLSINRSLTVEEGELREVAGTRHNRLPGKIIFVTPKTATSAATLSLLPVVSSRLKVLMAAEQPEPDALVFHRPDGSPIHPTADYSAWRDLLIAAEVPHVPLHAARNTTATLLKSLGVSEQMAREIMRHKTVAMTNHYQGADLDGQRKALETLEAALVDE